MRDRHGKRGARSRATPLLSGPLTGPSPALRDQWQARPPITQADVPRTRLSGTPALTRIDVLRYIVWMEALAITCCAPLAAPLLSDEETDATNLVEPLELSQPTVSHHMKKLLEVGLVDREQRGKWAYFSLKPEAARKLAAVADLKGVCC